MANQEQLRTLKRGVEAWNEYRRSNRHIKINLRGAALRGLNLSGADFSEADIRGTNFSSANLIRANFSGANCGLGRRWKFGLMIISCIMSAVSGFFAGFIGFSIAEILVSQPPIEVKLWFNIHLLITIVLSIIIIIIFKIKLKNIVAIAGTVVFTFAVGALLVGAFVVTAFIAVAVIFAFIAAVAIVFSRWKFKFVPVIIAVVVALIVSLMPISITRDFAQGKVPPRIQKDAQSILKQSEGSAGIPADVITRAKSFAQGKVSSEIQEEANFLVKVIPILTGAACIASALTIVISNKILESNLTQNENFWINSFGIAFVTIGGTSFYDANLTEANFRGARVELTDFREATLTRVYWYKAKILELVRSGDTYLKDPQVRQSLIGEGIDKNFDYKNLTGVNLQGADLTNASFIGTNLSEANLTEANLTNASLIRANLSKANLTEAVLTGACIENWNIDFQTNIDNIFCDYVYLKKDKDKLERIPYDRERKFKPGEFTKYIEKALNTVDLIFTDGIDWNAFLTSFKELQDKYGKENLGVQAIEKKSDGAFVIRLETFFAADKAEVATFFRNKYESKLDVKDREIQLLNEQKKFYIEQIKCIRQDNTKLIGIVTTMAEKEPSKVNMNFHAPVSSVAGNVEGDQNIYAPEEKQTLAEATIEIQKLLQQLEKLNPTATVEQKEAYVDAEMPKPLKERFISVLRAMSDTAIEEFLQRPYVKVVASGIKAWMLPD